MTGNERELMRLLLKIAQGYFVNGDQQEAKDYTKEATTKWGEVQAETMMIPHNPEDGEEEMPKIKYAEDEPTIPEKAKRQK